MTPTGNLYNFQISTAIKILSLFRNVEFRPSMYFVYCPCDDAVNSMREVEMRGFKLAGMPQRIMTDEIISGIRQR